VSWEQPQPANWQTQKSTTITIPEKGRTMIVFMKFGRVPLHQSAVMDFNHFPLNKVTMKK